MLSKHVIKNNAIPTTGAELLAFNGESSQLIFVQLPFVFTHMTAYSLFKRLVPKGYCVSLKLNLGHRIKVGVGHVEPSLVLSGETTGRHWLHLTCKIR